MKLQVSFQSIYRGKTYLMCIFSNQTLNGNTYEDLPPWNQAYQMILLVGYLLCFIRCTVPLYALPSLFLIAFFFMEVLHVVTVSLARQFAVLWSSQKYANLPHRNPLSQGSPTSLSYRMTSCHPSQCCAKNVHTNTHTLLYHRATFTL